METWNIIETSRSIYPKNLNKLDTQQMNLIYKHFCASIFLVSRFRSNGFFPFFVISFLDDLDLYTHYFLLLVEFSPIQINNER